MLLRNGFEVARILDTQMQQTRNRTSKGYRNFLVLTYTSKGRTKSQTTNKPIVPKKIATCGILNFYSFDVFNKRECGVKIAFIIASKEIM